MTTAPADPTAAVSGETITVAGLMKLFGLSRRTIERHLDRLPPPVRIGRRVFWFRDDVVNHLRTQSGART